MIPKIQNNKPLIIIFTVIYFFLMLFSFQMGKAMHPQENEINLVEGNISIAKNISHGGTNNYIEAIQIAMENMNKNPFDIFPLAVESLPILAAITLFMGLILTFNILHKEANSQTMSKDQNGSSKWNLDYNYYKKHFITPWEEQEHTPDPNMIISKNISLGLNIKEIEDKRNQNILIVGGSGTGKTFRFIKPNIMQMNSSMVITDPSGELIRCTGIPLIKKGVKVKLFSTSDMEHSNCYNPFDYVYDEFGQIDDNKVSTLIYLFLKNANGAKEKSGDPFWEKSAKALLSALSFYMLENKNFQKEDINFTSMLRLIHAGKVSEDSTTSESPLDKFMAEEEATAAKEGRISKAASNYKTFKLAPPKTANSILITCAVDLQIFDTEKVKNLTRTDIEDEANNLQLDKIGDEKTALFINIPQADGTFNFLVAMLYSQLFSALYQKGEKIVPKTYNILDKYGVPLFTMLPSEEKGKEIIENRKLFTIVERTTKRGAKYYRIMDGKRVLKEFMSKEYAEYTLKALEEAIVKKNKGNQLPFGCRCLLDEFANIGSIPDFDKLLATMRKYDISCAIVLQSIAQLKKMYEKEWEGIIGNCDTKLFLGSSENDTCKYFSEMLGKATIIIRNTSKSSSSKGGNSSTSFNHNGRNLMDPSEIAKMNNKKCIVIIRGLDPFLDEKYNFFKHPNYKLTGDFDHKQEMSEEYLDMYFNNTPIKKNNKRKSSAGIRKRITQKLIMESKEIKTKQDLLESVQSKTDEEFLEKVSSSPTISIPKMSSNPIKTNTEISAKTAPIPSDESSVFEFQASGL